MLSIIIVTFNSARFIKTCLESVFNQGYKEFETIVIDNGSADATVDFIKNNYPQVRLIINKNNLGPCRARNQGIGIASGEWILTLDCDVVLENGFISQIMEFAKDQKDSTAIIQPKILTKDGKIFSCGIRPTWLWRFFDIGRNLDDSDKFNKPSFVFGACCAAALYRHKSLEGLKDKYGYFDQRFFFLFEDADLSWRSWKKGWDCRYFPQANCYHQGNSSSTDNSIRRFLSLRNRVLTILKNQNPALILLFSPFYLVYDIPRFIFILIKFKGRFPKLNKI